MKKYVLVSFPEVQKFMGHSRWNECIFCDEIIDHPCPDSSYMVPLDLYNEVYNEDPGYTIDSLISKLQEARAKYGDLPITLDIKEDSPYTEEFQDVECWIVKDVIIDSNSVTLYNY